MKDRITQELAGIDSMTAAQLTEALGRYFLAVGGLASDTDLAIGRELVRRARRAEALEKQGEKEMRR